MARSLPVLQAPRTSHHDHQSAQENSELPVFQEAQLDRDGLDCLLADLDDLSELIEIRIKSSDGLTDASARPDLLTARRLLLDRRVAALQIIYRFADRIWCDTLIADGDETRLLRLEDPRHVD